MGFDHLEETGRDVVLGAMMPYAALAGAVIALSEPPHPEATAAGPAGDDLPIFVTPRNAKVWGQDY